MNTSTLSLIKSADASRTQNLVTESTIHFNLTNLAEQQDMQVGELAESVTHILANIASTASDGAPIKLMHLKSVAAFMAGVEAIATALPKIKDQQKTQNIIQHLQAAKVGPDGFVTTATAPIAQIGANRPELLAKYDQLVKDYALSTSRGQTDGQQLAQASRQLQVAIDQAMRSRNR